MLVMNAIEVHDLRKSYGDLEAVRGISFEVAAGEVFCLLGPNGAGKTTSVEIMEGYRLPDSGGVSVLGHDPARGDRAMRERVGIVLQQTGVQADLSVGELLEMYARYYPHPRTPDEVIELVELDAKRDERVAGLSGGQRRRLDLALALIGDPDLLFLDEPTTGFDPHARRQAWAAIRSLCSLGKTVFLTTHYLDEAQALADRVAVMARGQLVAIGPPAQLAGRDALPTEIRFALPAGIEPALLPDLDGELAIEGSSVLVRTGDSIRALNRLTDWALERDVALAGLAVSQPSLEDVYLSLTADTEISA
jgi:ABC-2 type transport system ATP-binding protein